MFVDFDVDGQFISQRPAKHVSGFSLGCIFFREQFQSDMFVGDGMVAGENVRLPSADQITARIAHVGDGDAIVAQGAGHNCGRHGDAAGLGRMTGINHARVCGPHQAR